jgi:hypothetical protein
MKAGKQSITADNVQISSDIKQRWQLTPRTAANFVTFLFLNRTTEILFKTERHSWNFYQLQEEHSSGFLPRRKATLSSLILSVLTAI